jgi:hypothetical protein
MSKSMLMWMLDGDKMDHAPSRLELKVLKPEKGPIGEAVSGTLDSPHQRFLGRCKDVSV